MPKITGLRLSEKRLCTGGGRGPCGGGLRRGAAEGSGKGQGRGRGGLGHGKGCGGNGIARAQGVGESVWR